MTRFIHTGDWQLGMTRHFLEGEAQARFTQDRFDAIVKIGEAAREREAEFVMVAGDVFEHNRLNRRTVVRALDALAKIPVPVYLLPGNHDTLDACSLYNTPTFRERCPQHIHVIRDAEPIPVAPGVQLIGAPWRSKRPLTDLVAAALANAENDGAIRIVAGHGAVNELNPNRDDPASISVQNLERLLEAGVIHYVGLGDRHSVTEVRPRIWYSGAHVATGYPDFQQTEPNHVLLVDIEPDKCSVHPVPVGSWRFLRREYHVDSWEDIDSFEEALEALPDKQRTVLKAGFQGTLDMALSARLDALQARAGDLLAAYTRWERKTNVIVTPTEADLEKMELHGFAQAGFRRILGMARVDSPQQQVAQDSLSLIYRLSGESQP